TDGPGTGAIDRVAHSSLGYQSGQMKLWIAGRMTQRCRACARPNRLKPVSTLFVVGVLLVPGAAFASSQIADAAMRGDLETVRTLLRQNANVNAPQADGTTALHWAVRRDDSGMTDMLLKAGANTSAANREGATPMLLAAVNGSAPLIEKLVAAG